MALELVEELESRLDILLEVIGDRAEGQHDLQVNPVDAVADFDQHLFELDLLVSRGLETQGTVREGGTGRGRRGDEVQVGVVTTKLSNGLRKLLKVVYSLEKPLQHGQEVLVGGRFLPQDDQEAYGRLHALLLNLAQVRAAEL